MLVDCWMVVTRESDKTGLGLAKGRGPRLGDTMHVRVRAQRLVSPSVFVLLHSYRRSMHVLDN
jgi:hypothetical protein